LTFIRDKVAYSRDGQGVCNHFRQQGTQSHIQIKALLPSTTKVGFESTAVIVFAETDKTSEKEGI